MSSGSQETRAEALSALARELRQSQALGAAFFRAAATRLEMTDNDMQVLHILETTGDASAGQLAELTGLTTGAITGMLNRLEEARLVHRERDPNDGRKVIVRLARDQNGSHKINAIFAPIGQAWEELAARYSDEQLALLLEFLQRSNALSQQELARLRTAPEAEGGTFSAPRAGLERARLVFATGITRLSLHADNRIAELYQARFEGPLPDVKVKEGVITIRYPRLLGVVDWRKRAAEVALNAAILWQIVIQGGALDITAQLGGLALSGLEVKGGMSSVRVELPVPSSMIPVRISGGASEVTMRRPAGVPARVHLKGWVSTFTFDEQAFVNLGSDVRLQSPGYQASAPGYDIEVASSASTITITTE